MFWQTLATGILVGISAMIVARRLSGMLSMKPNKPCGSCGGCAEKDKGPAMTPLVQLGSPKK